jgi:hypothetical protein
MGIPEASAGQFRQDTRKCDWLHRADAPGACETVLAAPLASTGAVYGQLHGYGPVRPNWLCADMN